MTAFQFYQVVSWVRSMYDHSPIWKNSVLTIAISTNTIKYRINLWTGYHLAPTNLLPSSPIRHVCRWFSRSYRCHWHFWWNIGSSSLSASISSRFGPWSHFRWRCCWRCCWCWPWPPRGTPWRSHLAVLGWLPTAPSRVGDCCVVSGDVFNIFQQTCGD